VTIILQWKLDFDFVFIDGEHGPLGLDQIEDLCRTAERHDVTTIARVPDIGSSTILRYLDRGVMGILGPHIATEADARQLVRACYFGPLGERSFGANRGTDYNAGIPDKAAYYREANEQMLVCALLEDVAVLGNLDAILSRCLTSTSNGWRITQRATRCVSGQESLRYPGCYVERGRCQSGGQQGHKRSGRRRPARTSPAPRSSPDADAPPLA
jgi:hypothetical protein